MISDFPYYSFTEELPEELCHGLIKLGNSLELVRGGLFESDGTKYDSRIRNNSISWINSSDIITLLYVYINRANIEAGWNFDLANFQTPQFCKYEQGQYYDWHVDIGTEGPDDQYVRKLTVVVALNENYTGGDFQVEKANVPTSTDRYNTVKELHKTGTITVFPSFMHHRVTPVENGTRYSLVGWFTGPMFR